MKRIQQSISALVTTLLVLLTGTGSALATPHPGLGPVPEGLDRSTPQRAFESFLDTTSAGNFGAAAYLLDLRGVPPMDQATVGAELAHQLRSVLDQKLFLSPSELSNEPGGNRDDGVLTEKLGEIPFEGTVVPVRMSRVAQQNGTAVWVFSRATVRAVPNLYEAYGPGFVAERLPDWTKRRTFFHMTLWQWPGLFLATLMSWFVCLLLAKIVLSIADRIARNTKNEWDDAVVARIRGPVRLFFFLIVFHVLEGLLRLAAPVSAVIVKVLGTLLIAAVAWLVMRVVYAVADLVLKRMVEGVEDPILRQGHTTKIAVTRQVVNAIVFVVAAALALTQFDVVRKVGVSLLASAGIAGVVVGLAAQKSLGQLLAGIQLSIAQPIRIGDQVQLEGDVGWIEEITLTYVSAKLWDGRRLILPITYFLEKHFENWTKTSPQIVGPVFVYADYRVPVQRLREKFFEILENEENWDRETSGFIVFDATADTVVLRMTMSAADGPKAWDLRCSIREKMIAFLQELDGGIHLPRTRVELEQAA